MAERYLLKILTYSFEISQKENYKPPVSFASGLSVILRHSEMDIMGHLCLKRVGRLVSRKNNVVKKPRRPMPMQKTKTY
jgi:hypothetical protein